MSELDRPRRLPVVGRRAVLRGGAAGLLFGLAACAAPTNPAPTNPAEAERGSPAPRSPGSDSPGPGSAGPSSSGGTSGSAAPRGPATELVRATSGRREVALTFHGAGDPGLARQVLEVLARGDAAVTVLAVGTWLARYPGVARMVTDLGHELGNHTWSHQTMSKLSVSAQREEIVRCRDRIVALTGGPGAFFRQSAAQHATATQLTLAAAAGYPRVLSYDVDSLDYIDPGPEVVRRQLRSAKPGSVVSMHLGHQGTLAALPGVLTDLKNNQLRAVSATRLFAP